MLGGRSLTRSSELEHSAFDDACNARASRAPHALNLRRELRGARLGSAQLPLQTIWHHAQSSNPEAGTRHAHAYVPMTRAAAAAAAAARCCSVVASAAAAARAAASSAAAAAAAAASASPCARRSPSAAARAAPSSVRTPARTSDALHTRTQQRNQRVHERSNKTRDIEFICMHAPRHAYTSGQHPTYRDIAVAPAASPAAAAAAAPSSCPRRDATSASAASCFCAVARASSIAERAA